MEKGREGGAWLAISPKRLKLAVLLNLSGNPKQNPKGILYLILLVFLNIKFVNGK